MKRKTFSILFALVLVFSLAAIALTSPVLAQPSEVWVDDDTCPNMGSGTQIDPFCRIQDGIDAVASPGTVHVAAGTYVENITLKDDVRVLGAGALVTTIYGGGGIGSVVIADSVASGTVLDGFTISGGSATNGGGMYNDNSSPTVINCIFSSNSASGNGGGMNNFVSSPMVTDCTFESNSARVGGGMCNKISWTTVTSCIFSHNSAPNGGGMYTWRYSPTITNCMFYSNQATWGGAMHILDSSQTVTNCTFHNNSAPWGGGTFNSWSSPTFTNCILYGNSGEIYDNYATPTVTYCDVQGGYSGAHNIDADPMFVDAANNDYHLQPESPCIDAGTDTGAPTEDIEGNPQPIDGDGDTIATTDIGAYEYCPPSP